MNESLTPVSAAEQTPPRAYTYFRLEYPATGGTVVVVTADNLMDPFVSFGMKQDLLAVVRKRDIIIPPVRVDFRNVQRFTTETIGALLSFKSELGTACTGGEEGIQKFAVRNLTEVQRAIFRVLNMDFLCEQSSDSPIVPQGEYDGDETARA